MYLDMDALGIAVRNYLTRYHEGEIVLTPSPTEGESEEPILARGTIVVGKDLSYLRTQCEWLGEIALDAVRPTKLARRALPRFLREDILAELEVYIFGLAETRTLFIATNGFKEGSLVAVGHWEENSRALLIEELGGYILLSHLTEMYQRDTIRCPPLSEEE